MRKIIYIPDDVVEALQIESIEKDSMIITKEQLIDLIKFTSFELTFPAELSTDEAEKILDDFINPKVI